MWDAGRGENASGGIGRASIKGTGTALPANAGFVGSTYGDQIDNYFGLGNLSYDDICPTNEVPYVHQYSRIAMSKFQVRRISITSKSRDRPGGNTW